MEKQICCPEFDPMPWDEKELHWANMLFLKDHVTSFFNIPLNFGAKMKKNMLTLEAAGAVPLDADMVVLAHDCSLWGMDIYIKTAKPVEHTLSMSISGTFLSKVFEGPYRNMDAWIKQMQQYVTAQGKNSDDLYFYYTTCPKCAKKYGRNYVVILAKIS
jgi:hypothetical protein